MGVADEVDDEDELVSELVTQVKDVVVEGSTISIDG